MKTHTPNDKEVVKFFIENLYLNNGQSLKHFLEYIEEFIINRALIACNGEQRKTARLLGLKYTTLHQKLKKYKINIKKIPY